MARKKIELIDEVISGVEEKKPKRVPKTFYLTEKNLKQFTRAVKGLEGKPTPSAVVDRLIEIFLEKL